MKPIGVVRRVIVSIKNNPAGLVSSIFLTYSVLWTILEPTISFLDTAKVFFSGWTKFIVFLIISVLIGVFIHLRPINIHIRIRNSVVIITFGDLFNFDDYKAIPISRFMLETDVMAASLQSVLIRKFLEDEGTRGLTLYEEQLKNALAKSKFDEINHSGSSILEKFYPLGTTAKVTRKVEKYLLFALTKTEKQGYIEADNCSVTDLWETMRLFWKNARIHARGESINIPLVGSGVSGIELPPQRILELNLLSIFNSIIEDGQITTNEIRIILHNRLFDEIDLRQLKSLWSKVN